MATAEATAPDAHHDHDHDHPEWLAHHFESPEQQFNAGKLGMWLFLAQEVLFFSGLFVAYTVYRANHPEVFLEAHHFLNPVLGALNTIVLLASSLAIAWAVRAAQKNQQQTLLWMHIFTLACAGFFMGVKVVEYGYKFDEGLFWAGYEREYGHWANGLESAERPLEETGFHTHLFGTMVWSVVVGGALFLGGWGMFSSKQKTSLGRLLAWFGIAAGAWVGCLMFAKSFQLDTQIATTLLAALLTGLTLAVLYWLGSMLSATEEMWGAVAVGIGLCVLGMAGGVIVANGIQQIEIDEHAAHAAHASHDAEHADAHESPAEHEAVAVAQEGDALGEEIEPPTEERATVPITTEGRPVNAGNFFSIYFAMTGVHALHIFAGIIAISWIVARIARGDFGPERYGPVEYTGLYWHLVDLVWIYLFPLLYLIR